jgi:hypothetical protein
VITPTPHPRSLYVIAEEIRRTWVDKNGKSNVNYAAKPYLDAMHQLTTISDNYGANSAKSIVLYFLSNTVSYRGEDARRLKAELKKIIK